MTPSRVTYDRVLLVDLNPNPGYPHCSCVSYANSGMPVSELESARFTKEFRLTARDLPIYDSPGHVYFVVAKMESDVDAREELRAYTAINNFVTEKRKAGVRLDKLPDLIVDGFKSRVQHRIPYVHADDRHEHPAPRQTGRRKRPVVSSSDQEGPNPKTLGLTGRLSALIADKTTKKRAATKQSSGVASQQEQSYTLSVTVNNDPNAVGEGIVLATGDTPVVFSSSASQQLGKTLGDQYAAAKDTASQADASRQQKESAASSKETPNPDAASASPQFDFAVPDSPVPSARSRSMGSRPPPSDSVADAGMERSKSAPTTTGLEGNAASKLLERLDAMDRKIDKRHARFLESFQYLISTVDCTSRDVADLKESIQRLSQPLISDELDKIAAFPLSTPEQVTEYLEQDPKLTHLIHRYTYLLLHVHFSLSRASD